MNFNDQIFTLDTFTIAIKERETALCCRQKSLLKFTLEKMNENYKYSQANKKLGAEYQHAFASLDDVIRTCENLLFEISFTFKPS
jgi:hypothetical protein